AHGAVRPRLASAAPRAAQRRDRTVAARRPARSACAARAQSPLRRRRSLRPARRAGAPRGRPAAGRSAAVADTRRRRRAGAARRGGAALRRTDRRAHPRRAAGGAARRGAHAVGFAVMDLGLQGKRCVVTGASRGIGRATAELLAAEGARLLLVGRDRDGLAEAAPRDAEILQADVTAPDAGERIVAACVERLGGIDVLVNNAGTSFLKALDELTDEDWDGQWRLNVRGPERLMHAAAPRMAEQGWGRIVNVCSTSGKRPSLRNAAYSVTKAAQLSLSRAYADAW